ncbi:MAG TPA: LPS export ABC transporter periplasmic protein LptC [Vicinamibacterales bacterium]|nr:LPS export ABC transporter periplasmic protein LptC [Vicinamibacterales bacterium]
MRWQKWVRVVLVLAAVGVLAGMAWTLRRRRAPQAPPPVAIRTDPKAVVESTSGRAVRFNRAHEDVRVEYERQLTYADGSTKLLQARVVADNRGDGRSFTLTGDEGDVAKDESVVSLNGHIRLVEGDGFTAETDHATYDNRDNIMRAPGAIAFHHDRMSGSGAGMQYDKASDTLTILEHAVMHMQPNADGKGAADVSAGHAVFPRMDHVVMFEGGVHVSRTGQVIDAGSAIAYLSDDDKRITVLELHDKATIAGSTKTAGGLQGISGKDVTLDYADDGQALEHAAIGGSAVIRLSGGEGKPGREISANALDVTLAPDGTTPSALTARGQVQLTLPANDGLAARSVTAGTLSATGDPEDPARGLTQAEFTTSVEYREKSAKVNRTATSARLDVGLQAAMAAFDRAVFSGGARFTDAKVSGTAPSVDYVADAGTLALSGKDAGSSRPHVFNDQITVDADTVDVTLAGPILVAKGTVKSVLQPPKKNASSSGERARLPSMLKQDQAVSVTADALQFDGAANKAVYDGHAQLWQTDTSIKGSAITIDSGTGNLSASGEVVTATVLEQTDKDKKKERVRSTATSKTFAYDDKARRAHYEGDVHFSEAENDMTADTVDLYLKPGGNELERAEAFQADNKLVLLEQGRRTTGTKVTYSAEDERYDVTGAPVAVVDHCGRVTNGRTLTFRKATDTIEINGNRRVRTQTKNGAKCQ